MKKYFQTKKLPSEKFRRQFESRMKRNDQK